MPAHDPQALTPHEREVLALVRVGLTNEEIAERLGITLDGAKYHVLQILSKLGVATREEAAAAPAATPPVRAPRRRRWWAAWPLAAKAVAAAVVVAALAGLGVLAWGVWETEEETVEAPRVEQTEPTQDSTRQTITPTPSSPESAATSLAPQGPVSFEGATMMFSYPGNWFLNRSIRPYFDEDRGDENVVLMNFDPAIGPATEGLLSGAIKMDFGSFPLVIAPTPVIDEGHEALNIDNGSGAHFLLGRLENGNLAYLGTRRIWRILLLCKCAHVFG
jgi:DNA-binding CsgD family transcriptional regulator